MALLNQTFEAAQLPESQSFDQLPAGVYHVSIDEAEVCNTKAGTGQYIKLKLNVNGPTHQGRIIFCNINFRNPNPKAEEIGLSQLRSLMAAIGIATLKDTDQLLGANLSVKVNIKKDEEYGDRNEVKQFKAYGGGSQAPSMGGSSMPMNQAAQQQQAQRPPAQQAQTDNGAPPWARKQQAQQQEGFDEDIPF